VATHLRSGRIFSDSIITNFLVILTVKKFENWSIFDEVKTYKNDALFVLPCISCPVGRYTLLTHSLNLTDSKLVYT